MQRRRPVIWVPVPARGFISANGSRMGVGALVQFAVSGVVRVRLTAIGRGQGRLMVIAAAPR